MCSLKSLNQQFVNGYFVAAAVAVAREPQELVGSARTLDASA